MRTNGGMRLANCNVKRRLIRFKKAFSFAVKWLLDNDNIECLRKLGEKVLRTLINKIPAQVAKHDNGWHKCSCSLKMSVNLRKFQLSIFASGYRGDLFIAPNSG